MPYFESSIWILIGLITGSFSNVCIDRLPLQFSDNEFRSQLLKSSKLAPNLKKLLKERKVTLYKPTRSFCFWCGYQLQWFENIPLISYILIKGHCRACKIAIPSRVFLTETMHGLLYGIFGWFFQFWVWSFFAGINFSFLWILAYCRSHQQLRCKLYYAGGILLMVNLMLYFFVSK